MLITALTQEKLCGARFRETLLEGQVNAERYLQLLNDVLAFYLEGISFTVGLRFYRMQHQLISLMKFKTDCISSRAYGLRAG